MLKADEGALSWFALRVKTSHEKRVALWLDCQGYEWFLPSYSCRRRWSDRIKKVELPLFPGYIFCRLDPKARLPILKAPSVLGIPGAGKTVIPVVEQEISALWRIANSGLPLLPYPFSQGGCRVRLQGCALDGLEGIIEDTSGQHRLILSVTPLQQSFAVEIDHEWVRHASSETPNAAA